MPAISIPANPRQKRLGPSSIYWEQSRLPFRLQAQGEFEYVGTKPLGTGCLPVLDRRMHWHAGKGISRRSNSPVSERPHEHRRKFPHRQRLHRPDHREFLSLRHPGSSRRPHTLLRQPVDHLQVWAAQPLRDCTITTSQTENGSPFFSFCT